MNNTYTITHCHTMLSNAITNIDSVTSYNDYVDFIKNNKETYGINAICFTEHGSIMEWYKKKCAVEEIGLKYIHSIEAYVTENINEKIRDNYHVCLYAKNFEGFKELNRLVSNSFNRNDNHFYYTPRITYDDLKNTSDNIIITTACLGGILGKGEVPLKKDFVKFLSKNKHRCYLEIQHHNVQEQIKLNKCLLEIHNKFDIPLIVGTDTHCLNEDHIEGRSILQKSKSIYFSNEDGWDLKLKSYDELVDLFKKQNIMTDDEIFEALNNTNKLYDDVENIDIDTSYKYPKLWSNQKEELKNRIKKGIKEKGIDKYENYETEYIPKIKHEIKTFIHNGAIDFMLLDTEIKEWAEKNKIYHGISRGSVSGSEVAYLLGMIDIDPIPYKLNFERFMNVERVSLADVDTDWQPNHRELIKQYLSNRKGLYCSDIITFNTIALKGSIRDVCKALYKDGGYNGKTYLEVADYICSMVDNEENEKIVRNEYKEVFRLADIINGTVISIGTHPSGFIVSPIDISENIGTCSIATSNYPVSMLYMKEVDALNFVKLDILGLNTLRLINETCELANIERLTPQNTPDEEKVWLSMAEDNTLIFQWESDSAKKFLQNLLSKETLDKIRKVNPDFKYLDLISMGNSAIRPAGESYRDALANGEFKDNGNKELNELLKDTNGYLVYQEQILDFLHDFCGFTMGEADVVRRGFSKKLGTEQFIPIIRNGGFLNDKSTHHIDGFIKVVKDKYNINEEEADKILNDFIKVIQDAVRYLFSRNHSHPYSLIGYECAWLKYYYPLEFITVALNLNKDDQDKISKITALANERNIEIKLPKFRYSKGENMPDKKTNSIYKGISSIKFCNSKIADELYELRNNKYDGFLSLLKDIYANTSVNSKQLDILIKLDYFSEFGKSQYLLDLVDIYNKFGTIKIIKKDKLESMKLDECIVKKYSSKETAKQYSGINNDGLVKYLSLKVKNVDIPLKLKIKTELDNIGYIRTIKSDLAKPLYFVLDAKEYNNKRGITAYVDMYNIKNGKEVRYKANIDFDQKGMFIDEKNGVLVDIEKESTKPKKKMRKDSDGNAVLDSKGKNIYDVIPGEFNNIMNEFNLY